MWKIMSLAHPVFSYTKNFLKAYGYTQNIFFSWLTGRGTKAAVLFPTVSCFPTHPAVLPDSHLLLSQQSYLMWLISFGYFASLCSSLCPLGSAKNNSGVCRMFRQQVETWLSAELHTTAVVVVGVGSFNCSPIPYGVLLHWVVEIFDTSAFWQDFCLSY